MNTMRGLLKWLAIASIAFALVIGGSSIARTFAQTPTTDSTQTDPATDTTDTTTTQRGWGMGDRMGRLGGMRRGGGMGNMDGAMGAKAGNLGLGMVLIDETAQQTEQNFEDVLSQLADGESLSTIAAASNVSEQSIIDAALQRVEDQLTEAVSNGRIDETQKATMLEKAAEKAPELMQQTGLGNGMGPGMGGGNGRMGGNGRGIAGRHLLIEATADVTGLTNAEVRAELNDGKSLAQIAEAHGKTGDDILANLRTRGEAQLQTLLDNAAEEINTVPGK